MKSFKVLVSILALMLLTFSLLVVSFAEDDSLVLAEDYSYFEYGGQKYVRVRNIAEGVDFVYSDYFSFSIVYTEKQESEIEDIELSGREGYFARLSIDFINGGRLYEHYVSEEYLDEYNSVADLTSETYSLYINGDRMYIDREILFGEECTITAGEILTYRSYGVDITFEPFFCLKDTGEIILSSDGACYYLDYAENNSHSLDFSLLDHDSLVLHKITDSGLCAILQGDGEIEKGSRAFIYTTAVMLSGLFGVLPLALGALCIVKRRGAKEPYRRLYTVLTAVCAIAVIIFLVLLVTVIPYI